MKKIAFGLIFVLSVIASLLFTSQNNIAKTYASSLTQQTEDSKYLVKNEQVYQSTEVAGVVEGYGYYLTNELPNLTATANEGFVFAGWVVNEVEAGVLKKESFETTYKGASLSCEIEISNNKKTSTISLNRIAGDFKIWAVFSYEYYNFELDQTLVSKLAMETVSVELANSTVTTDDDTVEILCTGSDTSSEVWSFENAIINNNYYGTLNYNGTMLYTVYDGENIDYSLGAFRLNDSVEFTLDLNTNLEKLEDTSIKVNELNLANVDVKSFSVKAGIVEKTLKQSNGEFALTTDSTRRTESFSINTKISTPFNHKLNWQFDNIYVVDVVVNIDGSNFEVLPTDDNETKAYKENALNLIYANIKDNDNYQDGRDDGVFYKVSSKRYLIKNPANQSGYYFQLTCNQTVSAHIDGATYKYYTFRSLADNYQNQATFSPSANREIVVKYDSAPYYINWKFALYENGEINTDISQEFEFTGQFAQVKELKRNSSAEIVHDGSNLGNTGYKFKGFANENKEFSADANRMTVSIETYKPKDVVAYIVLEAVEYKIKVVNKNPNVYLTNSKTSTRYYPIEYLTISKSKLTESYSGSDLASSKTSTLSLKDGDSFELLFKNNSGFKFAVSVMEENSELTLSTAPFTFADVVNAEFYEEYGIDDQATEIVFYLYSDYETYTTTYTIDPAVSGSSYVIMADIYAVVSENTIEAVMVDGSYVVTIENLKRFDAVSLFAKSKSYATDDQGNPVYYKFERFTTGSGVLNLGGEEISDNLFEYSFNIESNASINVVFSPRETQLKILFENGQAISLEEGETLEGLVVVYQNDIELPLGVEVEGTLVGDVYQVKAGNVVVDISNLLSNQGTSRIMFGYFYAGYELLLGEETKATSTENNISFEIAEQDTALHTLIIRFTEVVFKTSVLQIDATGDKLPASVHGSYVVFGSENFVNLSGSNSVLEFNIPGEGGIYISKVVLNKSSVDSKEFTELYQQAGINHSVFSKDLSAYLQSFVQYLGADLATGQVELNFTITYSITKFDLVVNLTNSTNKTNGYTDLTKLVTFTLNGYDYVENVNQVVFKGIPYGTENLILNAIIAENAGLSASGWKNYSFDLLYGSTPTSTEIKLGKVVDGYSVNYVVNYLQYRFEILHNSDMGSPKVNNGEFKTTSFTVKDEITITTNANKQLGYKFVALFGVYSYNESTWNSEYSNVYVYSSTSKTCVANTNPTYNPAQTYYVMLSMNEKDSTVYVDEEFLLENYVINNGIITIVANYNYIEIAFEHEFVLSGKTSLTISDLQVDVSEFAKIIATDVSGTNLLPDSTVDVRNGTIFLTVNMVDVYYEANLGKFVVDNNPEGNIGRVKYNLSLGVSLSSIKSSGWKNSLSLSEIENGYTAQFNLESVIPSLSAGTEVLKITYTFKVETCIAKMTTNIPETNDESSFYKQTQGVNAKFQMKSDSGVYGFNNKTTSSAGSNVLADTQQFLAATEFSYSFYAGSDYAEYLKITSFELRYNNQTINKANYEKYGITIIPESDISFKIKVRYLFKYNEKTDKAKKFNAEYGLAIILKVEPVINIANAIKEFSYDFENKTSNAHQLTFGSTSEFDVQMAEFLLDAVTVEYYDAAGNRMYDGCSLVGIYTVKLKFSNTAEYAWLASLLLPNEITMEVVKQNISIGQTAIPDVLVKTYNGKSSISFDAVAKYLTVTTTSNGKVVTIPYSEAVGFSLVCGDAFICDSLGVASSSASDTVYSVMIKDLNLQNTPFLRNFTLQNSEILLNPCVKILQKEISINNIEFADKVYDGTTDLQIVDISALKLDGILTGDSVTIDINNLKISFADGSIGLNKEVNIDTSKCLFGTDAGNYKVVIANAVNKPSIYPYSLSVEIENFGVVELINKRGLTDRAMVAEIPIDAELKVELLYKDTPSYNLIYSVIRQHLVGNKDFAIGYTIKLDVNGTEVAPSNNLYLKVPNQKRLMGIVALTGEHTGELKYSIEDECILVDLSQIQTDVQTIVVTKQKTFFKLWQLILIASITAVVVGSIVLTVVIIRKKKLKRYSINEKI